MKPQIGYQKNIETACCRHGVGFACGTRAMDIAADLSKVPPEAKLIDIDCDDSGVEMLIFESETP